MAIRVTWRCTKPNLGLREAMARMAEEIAYEGEYSEVEILSTTKTTSGGKKVAPHFKVRLLGNSNGHDVVHSHLIKVEHRDGNGNPRRFQMTGRPSNYDYTTLQAKNNPPVNSPKKRRLERERAEREAAEAARAAEEAGSAQGQGAPMPNGWYPCPWDPSGATQRYYENGQWSGHTNP